MRVKRWLTMAGCLMASLLLASCRSGQPVSLDSFFPQAGAISGWIPDGEVKTFDRETLFNFMDGQAEFFFDYGFEKLAVRTYQNTEGSILGIEVWQLATPADAYGIYAGNASETIIAAGRANESTLETGRRLVFWQNRYFVHVRALKLLPDGDLRAFAEAISQALPSGGEPPKLLKVLPAGQMAGSHTLFFHGEMSIQTELWLGGENVLGLSEETDGVLARYHLGGYEVRLLLVQYPNEKAASTGLDALKDKQPEGLVVADSRDKLLGAVFGEISQEEANTLLAKALNGQ